MSVKEDDLNIGAKVRKLRRANGVSLQQLARETGMSYSYLSALENDKHSISVTNLQRLARYFQVDMVYFLENRPEAPVQIHGAEYFTGDVNEVRYDVVTSRNNRQLQVSYVTLPEHSLSEHNPHRHAPGSEEYIMVLQGEVVVRVSEETYTLCERDAVCFASDQEHLIFTQDQPAQIIIVGSPPYGRAFEESGK